MLIYNAGSRFIKLFPINYLRSDGGVAYNKVYNINKTMFIIPFKGYDIFGNPQFEAVRFSDHQLAYW